MDKRSRNAGSTRHPGMGLPGARGAHTVGTDAVAIAGRLGGKGVAASIRAKRPGGRAVGMKQLATASGQPPSLGLLSTEPFRAVVELSCHTRGRLPGTQPGDGHPVVIFPGLGGNGASVAALREHCRLLGYDAFDWGEGISTGPHGDFDAWLYTLKSQLADRLADHTQEATLIGWSLGGLYAREIGKLMAPHIRQVITMGTPFNVQDDQTDLGWLFRWLGGNALVMDPALRQRLRTPPPLRTTSIYSRSDGVVAWQTCRHDTRSSLVQDIEVDCSHVGMGWNRDVLAAVADRLGQPTGPWRRYVRAQ